jgi:hypothetical protein
MTIPNHAVFPPGTKNCTGTAPGAEVQYFEALDVNLGALDAGEGIVPAKNNSEGPRGLSPQFSTPGIHPSCEPALKLKRREVAKVRLFPREPVRLEPTLTANASPLRINRFVRRKTNLSQS